MLGPRFKAALASAIDRFVRSSYSPAWMEPAPPVTLRYSTEDPGRRDDALGIEPGGDRRHAGPRLDVQGHLRPRPAGRVDLPQHPHPEPSPTTARMARTPRTIRPRRVSRPLRPGPEPPLPGPAARPGTVSRGARVPLIGPGPGILSIRNADTERLSVGSRLASSPPGTSVMTLSWGGPSSQDWSITAAATLSTTARRSFGPDAAGGQRPLGGHGCEALVMGGDRHRRVERPPHRAVSSPTLGQRRIGGGAGAAGSQRQGQTDHNQRRFVLDAAPRMAAWSRARSPVRNSTTNGPAQDAHRVGQGQADAPGPRSTPRTRPRAAAGFRGTPRTPGGAVTRPCRRRPRSPCCGPTPGPPRCSPPGGPPSGDELGIAGRAAAERLGRVAGHLGGRDAFWPAGRS